jgi:hypothetical protein
MRILGKLTPYESHIALPPYLFCKLTFKKVLLSKIMKNYEKTQKLKQKIISNY